MISGWLVSLERVAVVAERGAHAAMKGKVGRGKAKHKQRSKGSKRRAAASSARSDSSPCLPEDGHWGVPTADAAPSTPGKLDLSPFSTPPRKQGTDVIEVGSEDGNPGASASCGASCVADIVAGEAEAKEDSLPAELKDGKKCAVCKFDSKDPCAVHVQRHVHNAGLFVARFVWAGIRLSAGRRIVRCSFIVRQHVILCQEVVIS